MFSGVLSPVTWESANCAFVVALSMHFYRIDFQLITIKMQKVRKVLKNQTTFNFLSAIFMATSRAIALAFRRLSIAMYSMN